MRNDDVNLPWQFVLLGFFAFGAIFAVMLLAFSFMPSMQMSNRTIYLVRWVAAPYLAVVFGTTPYLIRTGRGKFRQINPEPGADGRRGTPMPRGKRFVVSAVAFLAGLLMSLYSYSEAAYSNGGRYTIYLGLVGVGLTGMVAALLAPEEV